MLIPPRRRLDEQLAPSQLSSAPKQMEVHRDPHRFKVVVPSPWGKTQLAKIAMIKPDVRDPNLVCGAS